MVPNDIYKSKSAKIIENVSKCLPVYTISWLEYNKDFKGWCLKYFNFTFSKFQNMLILKNEHNFKKKCYYPKLYVSLDLFRHCMFEK